MSEGKTCSTCREVKPRDSEHFNKNRKQQDGFANVCKECRKKERATDKIREYNRNYARACTRKMLKIKSEEAIARSVFQ